MVCVEPCAFLELVSVRRLSTAGAAHPADDGSALEAREQKVFFLAIHPGQPLAKRVRAKCVESRSVTIVNEPSNPPLVCCQFIFTSGTRSYLPCRSRLECKAPQGVTSGFHGCFSSCRAMLPSLQGQRLKHTSLSTLFLKTHFRRKVTTRTRVQLTSASLVANQECFGKITSPGLVCAIPSHSASSVVELHV